MMVVHALWIVTVLALMVGTLAGGLHHAVVRERRALERAELRVAAISGLQAYALGMEMTASRAYSHRDEPFRRDPHLCAFDVGPEIRTVSFHTVSRIGHPEPVPAFGARDEENRINLLTADADLLAQLPGVTPGMAERWIDYRQAHAGLHPRGLEEMSGVPGWQASALDDLADLVTFYGDGRVNLNTASSRVLGLVGLSDRAVQALVSFLSGPNGVSGDEDDRFFKGLSEIVPRLREHGADDQICSQIESAIVQGRFSVVSEHYSIRSRSVHRRTGAQLEIRAVLHSGSPPEFLDWREFRFPRLFEGGS